MGALPRHFNRTYDEALGMVIEARNYMRYTMDREESLNSDGKRSLRYTSESLRITTRLTQVMSWLMFQRAVQDGEMTQEEALSEHNRLSAQNICLEVEDTREMPPGLISLLDRSRQLYERVSRLEETALRHLHYTPPLTSVIRMPVAVI